MSLSVENFIDQLRRDRETRGGPGIYASDRVFMLLDLLDKMREREASPITIEAVEALATARKYVEVYDTREHNTEQDAALTQIDAAIALLKRDDKCC